MESGNVSNKQVLIDTSTNNSFNGPPDGMTIDKNGYLWVSLYSGGRIVKVNAENGQVEDYVSVPAKLSTTPVFGGTNLSDIYLTTAYRGLTDKERQDQPNSGRVFKITGVGQGAAPAYRCKPQS